MVGGEAAAVPADTGVAQHAISLLRTDAHDPEAIELALGAVVLGGPAAVSAFGLGFGPRHLMKAISHNRLTDRAAELADELLAACGGGGLTRDVDFGDIHREQLYPDEIITLTVGEAPALLPGDTKRVPVHLMLGRAAFTPENCDLVYSDEDTHDDLPAEPVLRLRNPSRRERLGAEIECKVWPSAIILGRWLYRHTRLIRGKRVLECAAPLEAPPRATRRPADSHAVAPTTGWAPALVRAAWRQRWAAHTASC